MGIGTKRRMNDTDEVINTDVSGFHMRMVQHLQWLETLNYSKYTIYYRRRYFIHFFAWCELRGIVRPSEITRPILQRYQRHLAQTISTQTGAPLSTSTQLSILMGIKLYFRWLIRNNHILYNPAADIDLPRKEKKLPQSILTVEEIERILAEPDISEPLGLRDRTILELFYSTGIRRSELANLMTFHINTKDGILRVEQGKGKKDRMLPVGSRACKWVDKYLEEVRPRLVCGRDDKYLFLTYRGDYIVPNAITFIARKYVESSGVGYPGSCHIFRHACATHMMNNGADLRFIQAMLGHGSLESTQIYTFVAIAKLKEVHDNTHPAEK